MNSGGRERKLSTEGQSLYAILGVDKRASPEEIRRAYRRLALRHHPDKNPGDPTAEERFKEIARAYSILSDDAQRQVYDQYGSMGLYFSDMFGPERADLYCKLMNPWTKAFILCCGILTCCYCCFCCCMCCNCCCGRCLPKDMRGEDFGGADPSAAEVKSSVPEDAPIESQPMNRSDD